MNKRILELLSDSLPAVDFKSDFIFSSLDSLGVATLLVVLSDEYGINLSASDVSARNLRNIDSIEAMVNRKLVEKFNDRSLSVESAIEKFAALTPDKCAAVCGDESIAYSELWKRITERSDLLRGNGLQSGRPYVFRASQDIEFLVNYFAIHKIGAIAVPLGCDVTEENFHAVEAEVQKENYSADIADILYTTGTTGKSKGVMISYACIAACADNFINDLKFSSDLLFLITGPLNHIASLFKIHPMLTVGGTLCIMEGLKDMEAFFKVFDLPFKKFGTFMVPASLRMIMQFSYQRLCSLAPKIDFIETGAAPITQADMEKLSKALPNSRLYNTYGGTEIGCVSTYNFNDGKYMEGCIGTPLKNSVVEINEEGGIIVSGPVIMSGYVADQEESRKVLNGGKIHGADLGYFDENGLIHLTGRTGDVINVGGYKVNPVEVENAAASFPGIRDCICIKGNHPVIGTVLKLLVVLDDGIALDKHSIALHIKERLDSYKVPTLYEQVDKVRHTYNGKVDRKSYQQEQ